MLSEAEKARLKDWVTVVSAAYRVSRWAGHDWAVSVPLDSYLLLGANPAAISVHTIAATYYAACEDPDRPAVDSPFHIFLPSLASYKMGVNGPVSAQVYIGQKNQLEVWIAPKHKFVVSYTTPDNKLVSETTGWKYARPRDIVRIAAAESAIVGCNDVLLRLAVQVYARQAGIQEDDPEIQEYLQYKDDPELLLTEPTTL